MSNSLLREIAGLELMLGQELSDEKKKRAEDKLKRLRDQQANQSMNDTVIMTAEEKSGHTPRRFHRPSTARRPR